MTSSKTEVARFLAMIKGFAQHEFVIIPRKKNRDFMLEWGIDHDTAKDIVMCLKTCDYVKGPCEDDRDLGRNDIWVFGKDLSWEGDTVETYIKVTISKSEKGLGCICISFHESDYPLRYCYGGEQREVYLLP